ncbi:MAG: Rubredoxin [Methanoregulaceae archaeon PtaB.Bin056]|nr:MAG: Rubredoxin [Methanoregulaceae archaeon PtaB.Bin056]
MDSYQCMICGHVYDPARGEPSGDVPPGTDFLNLPNGWRCPVCQASPDKFRKV